MPRSKRNKIVSLTKTGAKGKALKSKLIEVLRQHIDEYDRVYVFGFENMRTAKFRDVRMEWKESTLFLGKNSVAQVAFGRSPEEEYKDNLRHVAKLLDGDVGILFTSRKHKDVVKYFKNFHSDEFALAGTVPTERVEIPAGPLTFPVSMLDHLRRLGMVVEVEDGVLQLREPVIAAEPGVPLTPEQAKILVKFDRRIVPFTIKLLCHWENGKFSEL